MISSAKRCAMRRTLVVAGAVALARRSASPSTTSKRRASIDHAVALALDRALHERLRADRRPVLEVDRVGGDAGALRVLDVGAAIDHAEEAREIEVASRRCRRTASRRARRSPSPFSGETAIGKLVAPGPTIVPRTCAPARLVTAIATTVQRRRRCHDAPARSFSLAMLELPSSPSSYVRHRAQRALQIGGTERQLDVGEVVAVGLRAAAAADSRASPRARPTRHSSGSPERSTRRMFVISPDGEDAEAHRDAQVGARRRPTSSAL